MPVEIKELHIRVAINTPENGKRSESGTVVPGNGSVADESAKDAIVAECVEQVLQVIQNKAER
jgi:co-chaperonin GroES (HSP10)